jgi:hypothetical protein
MRATEPMRRSLFQASHLTARFFFIATHGVRPITGFVI